jgi:hypothetical protein
LISLPGPAWRGAGYTPAFLVVDVRGRRAEDEARPRHSEPRASPKHHRPPVRAATATLISCALGPLGTILWRRRCSLSMPLGPSAGPSGGANVRLTWQNQGKRHPTPRSRRTARTMFTATQCRCARTLLRWSISKLVERRFGEPKRHRPFRTGTSGAERYYDRRYSARL